MAVSENGNGPERKNPNNFKLEKGLRILMKPGSTSWSARAFVDGKEHYTGLQTADIERAKHEARSWFFRLKRDNVEGSTGSAVSFTQAAKSFIRRIPDEKRRKYHQVKWDGMSQYFKGIDVDMVDSPWLVRFVDKLRDRKNGDNPIKEITVHKYLVTTRKVMKFSIRQGWIKTMPLFPELDKMKPNPRPWFEPDEWSRLLEEAEERVEIAKDEPGKHRHSRQDLVDFMRLMVATCMRVDELRSVKVKDVQILTKPDKDFEAWQREEARLNRTEEGIRKKTRSARRLEAAFTEHKPTFEYLQIHVIGKTGERMAVTRKSDSGVDVFKALVNRKNLKPDDLLFTEHHRDAFRELLLSTKPPLRMSKSGITRNFKSLRCTGLMLWVLENPKVNLKLLANSAGTSVTMLDQFYLKPLHVEMNRDELVDG
jgi:integrase